MDLNIWTHAFMYTYFALKSAYWRVPRAAAVFVTVLQISQMVAGCFSVYYVYTLKAPCPSFDLLTMMQPQFSEVRHALPPKLREPGSGGPHVPVLLRPLRPLLHRRLPPAESGQEKGQVNCSCDRFLTNRVFLCNKHYVCLLKSSTSFLWCCKGRTSASGD